MLLEVVVHARYPRSGPITWFTVHVYTQFTAKWNTLPNKLPKLIHWTYRILYGSNLICNFRIFLSWIWMAVWTCVNQEGYERSPFLNGTECTHKTVQTTTNTVEQICSLCLVSRVTQHSLCREKRNDTKWITERSRCHLQCRSVSNFYIGLIYKRTEKLIFFVVQRNLKSFQNLAVLCNMYWKNYI